MKSHQAKPRSGHPSEVEVRGIIRSGISSSYVRRAPGLVLVCLLFAFSGPPMQGAQNNKNKVEFLVARDQVNDPFFRHSVVIMLPESETQLVVGLIINKPTRVTLAELLPNTPAFKERTDIAYFGGPVDLRIPSIIFRSDTTPDDALRLYGNVYLTFDSDLISQAFQSPQPAARARLFLGRAQWAPGQLQNEIRRGGWDRIEAEGDLVFSSHPDNLWPTLHARSAPSKYIRYQLPPGSPQPSARKIAVM